MGNHLPFAKHALAMNLSGLSRRPHADTGRPGHLKTDRGTPDVYTNSIEA
jgi:hypothetical protein